MLRPTRPEFTIPQWFAHYLPHWNGGHYPTNMDRQKQANFLFSLNYLALQPDYIGICHLQFGLLEVPPKPQETYSATKNLRLPLEGRPLRIGILSGDLRRHTVASFLFPLVRHRDRSQLHVTLFRCGQNALDDYSKQFRELADHWVDAGSSGTARLAAQIYQENIDVLVDLAGHTGGNRLDVMSRHAAPLQATWLGYPNTTGLRDVHYRLTDWVADPCDTMQVYSERLVRMPVGSPFLCYELAADAPPVSLEPPARANGYITFGSLSSHNLAKINTAVLDCWARVLRAVPNSRLLVKAQQFQYPGATNQYRALLLEKYGISHVELLPCTPSSAAHLALYARVDIVLDTFPYNGTSTTSEALCMGVPVVVLQGQETHVERVGASILTHAGCKDFLAKDTDDYVLLAQRLASDVDHLARLRSTLRQSVQASALCNGPLFAREFTQLWRQLYQRWEQQGALPIPPEALVPAEEETSKKRRLDTSL